MASEKPTTIRFPKEYKLDLKVQAAKRGITMEALILDAYLKYIAEPPKSSEIFDVAQPPSKRRAGGRS